MFDFDIKNLVVHIRSVEQGRDVVTWFAEQGYHTEALVPDIYMEYPYFYVYDKEDTIISGRKTPPVSKLAILLEYEDWLEATQQVSDFEIDEASFCKVLNLGFEVANNG